MIPSLLLLLVHLHSIAPASPPKNTDVMAELRAMAGGEITIPNDIAKKAIQVFQQVQEEFTTEKQQLSTSTNPQTMQFWSALQAIRRKENSGKFLRSMQQQVILFKSTKTQTMVTALSFILDFNN